MLDKYDSRYDIRMNEATKYRMKSMVAGLRRYGCNNINEVAYKMTVQLLIIEISQLSLGTTFFSSERRGYGLATLRGGLDAAKRRGFSRRHRTYR